MGWDGKSALLIDSTLWVPYGYCESAVIAEGAGIGHDGGLAEYSCCFPPRAFSSHLTAYIPAMPLRWPTRA